MTMTRTGANTAMIVAATETITIAGITGVATAEAPDFSFEAAKPGSQSSAIEGSRCATA
jgi:hypothetical protein